jgi:protein TonB
LSRGTRARATAVLASYITGDDYPASAARNNEQGRVTFTLVVGPSGQVTDCQIRATSGSAALDSATCRILRSRARFTPARDAQGRPTTDTSDGSVAWRLED